MDQRLLFPKRDLSPHYSASDSEEKEFSDDDDDRNHKHRRRETQPHSQERNLDEGSIQPYRNRNKPFGNGHPHREATSQSNEAWRNYNMPPLEKDFPENFDKRRHGSTAVSRAPLDLNQRVRGNQSWTGDPGSGRGRGRELGPWSIHDSRFNSLDFNPAIVQQGYVPSGLFAGRGMPTVSNAQSASWNAFGLVQGLPNGGLDSLHSIGLQRTLRPSSMNMGIPHQRCRDFEERGFCLRGDMCPMEHGINRIVIEDVQSLSQFNLPVSIPSAHLMGASAVPGPLSAVSAPNTSGNGQGVYNKSSKAGAEDVGLDLNGTADGSAVASGADFYDPDQPLWASDCARTSSTILTPDPTKANRGDNQAGLPHDAEMGLYSGLDDERPIKYTGDALGSHNTNLPVRGQIGASENRINSGHIGSVTYEDQLLDTAKDAVGHHGKISKADDIVSHATDLSMKTLNNSAHFVQKQSQKAQCTLFVSGVPHIDNKRDALLSHFQKFGEVINIYIPSNSERAFVQFSKREEAEDALKAPDAVMGNRFIKMWWANRDNIPLDKVNSTIASRAVAAASVPYNPDAAIKEKDISKGSSFHDSISAGIASDRPKSVLTNGPPPPMQKKVENLDYLKEIRKKQEMLDKKRNEFKQALEKLEKQKQATGIKAELTAEQTAKRQKTKTVTDIHTAGSPSSIGSSCIVSSTQAELTDRSRSEGNAKPHKSNTSTMVALTESSSFKPSPHQQAPAAPPFVLNRFKLDNRPTSFKIASPLPNGLANVSALKEHFSTFGELSNVDLEDIKVEDNAAESAGSNKRACIYFTTRLSQGCILGASTLDNIEEWKWKLSKLIRNKDEQEVVSRERKDRRDFQQISALAVRMGLYSQQYSKVVVISKVPLPNYRSDLDDRRPQRKVVLPYGLEHQLVAYLKKYIGGKSMNKDFGLDNSVSRSSHEGNLATNQGIYWQEEPITRTSHVAEKILHRRSLEILNKQQSWQNSLEGQKMLEFRKSLPAYKEKDSLLRQIAQNQVVVVSGETGCGKTTQLPQYILESEVEATRGAVCSIICTQPRRISAMSVAERVAAERGEKLGESVGFKVRLEGMKGRDTRLLFCTTGILLRRLLVDRMLKGVTHVIVDEIHERGMNEDFLLIVLKELLPRRPELRLILMSATLNADLFSSYFGSAPMIHIPGFTYPVRSHFLENILEMTGYRLTTYNQIDNYGQDKMWKMQKQTLKRKKTQIASTVEGTLEAFDLKEYSLRTRDSLSCWNPDSIGFNLIEHVLCYICRKERPGAVLVFMTGWDDINSLKSQLQAHPLLGDPSKVLLLGCHGSMDSSEQRLIFNRPEEGIRKIVLATNMAETSITINDVVFVVDCGKAKETSYDALNNTPCLLPSWISKASARQRRGRAGRVQPGECFHLYPRCVHDAFADYQLPELLRTPLQSLCLQIKSLQLGSISDFLSRALQPPEPLSVQNAIEYLKTIGALDEYENLTVLGQKLSMLPVEPKLGKMLILGAIFNCLNPIMTLVAGLSVRDPFLMPFDRRDLAEAAKAQLSSRDFSDHLALIRAYDGWKDAEKRQAGYDYCWNNFLSAQTLRAIDSLRKQFLYLLKDTGLVDNIDKCNSWSHDEHLIRAITCAGLFPGICSVVNKGKSISLKTMEDGPVLLHSNSVNAQQPRLPYPWLVFNEKVKVNSVMLRDSTAVCDSMVLLFGGSISRGGLDGHLKMLGGYLEFFMKPGLAETYLRLRKELEELLQMKLLNPKLDINDHNELLSAVRLVVADDRGDGKFVYGRQLPAPSKKKVKEESKGTLSMGGTDNSKNHLRTLLNRAGHESPTYKTKQLKNNKFRSVVMFNGLNFDGQPCTSKKQAEKDAASEALQWLIGDNQPSHKVVDHMSTILKKSKRKPEVHASKWR